jgi:hypothetical protein
MHHDPLLSSQALKVFSWGHDWVVLAWLVRCPRWAPTQCVRLAVGLASVCQSPGLAKGKQAKAAKKKRPRGRGVVQPQPKKKNWRPANPNQRTRLQLLVELLTLLARWFPERQFVVGAETGYAGKSVLRQLPTHVDLSQPGPSARCAVGASAAAHGPAWCRRKQGERWPGLQAWADDASPWQALVFDQYGLHTTLPIKVQQALYYTPRGPE